MKIENKFYEATVVDINDTQLAGIVSVRVDELMTSQNTHDGENINYKKGSIGQHFILARPANKYYDGKIAKHKTPAGKYSSPLKNERIVVFFLNKDVNKCYYIPDMSIRGVGENIKGFNLDIEDLNDFMEISRRPYMKVQEFYNRNIIGFNNNPDSQHFFFKFDNGTELHFRSPNENSKISSNYTKASEWEVIVKRHDSFYSNAVKQSTTQDRSYISMSAKKEKPQQHITDYDVPVDSIDNIKSTNVVNVESGTASNSRYVEYSLDKRRASSYSNTVTSNQSNTNNVDTYRFDELDSNVLSNKDIEVSKNGVSTNESITNTHHVKNESVIYNTVNNVKIGLVNIITNITFKIMNTLNITSKTESLINKGGILINKNDSIVNEDDKDYINVTNNMYENVNKDGILRSTTSTKSYKSDGNKKIISSNTITTNDSENSSNIDMVSDAYESSSYLGIKREVSELSGEVTDEESFRISSVKQYTRNPVDVTRSLDMDPLFTRGHEVSSSIVDGVVTTQLKSIKESTIGSHVPTMGNVNTLSFVEEGTRAELEIDLKGVNKSANVRILLSTDDNGKLIIDIPQGDVDISSKHGNISAVTKYGTVSVAGDDIKVKAKNSLELLGGRSILLKADNIDIKANSILDMKSNMFTIKGLGTIKGNSLSIDSRIVSLGSGASNAMLRSNAFMVWANTHIHNALGPTSPTSPPVTPLLPTALSTSVFNK